jgi:pimeloyl-ACP methyl ester carboxylesterase
LEWVGQGVSSVESFKLIFLEVGHFDSFQEIVRPLESMGNVETLILRYDLYQILQGDSEAQQILRLVKKLQSLERFILVGVSFNGWLAAKIAERLSCPVILLDSPFYLGQRGAYLNTSLSSRFDYVKNQIQAHGITQVFPQLIGPFWRRLSKKLGLKKSQESIFQRSVNEFLSQSTPVEKLSDLLYIYSTQSSITAENDISLWSEKTANNFQLFRLDGRHLDSCSPKFGHQVAQLMCDFALMLKKQSEKTQKKGL